MRLRVAASGWGRSSVFVACLLSLLAPAELRAQGADWRSPPPEDSVAALEAPLFSSRATLDVRIELPIRRLKGDRDQDSEERPATWWIIAPAEHAMRVPVDIRTRGNFRLQRSTCDFPPLRLDFPKDSLAGTLLDGENRLKLVTHCRDDQQAEQRLLQEYLIYRMYNLVTDKSFRVRLARVRYVDAERADSLTRYAFLIESADRMAARSGMTRLDSGVAASALDPGHLVQLALFQFMIGNTDWAAGEERHNIDVIANARRMPIPVPFDFDWSGLISAPYAKPDPSLGLRSVRERLFFLGCIEMEHLQPYLQTLRDLRSAFDGLVAQQEGLARRTAEQTIGYLREFYDLIDDPRRAARELTRRC